MLDYLILGGGIAGLTAAYELQKRNYRVTLVEKGTTAGGLARTFSQNGFRFDLGGHRFHSNNPSVVNWLKELLQDDLLTVPRVSHIYLNGRFTDYPLQFPDALATYPPTQAAVAIADYLRAKVTERQRPDRSFEDWVVKRFGHTLYKTFFQPYTQKVWGLPCHQISAEWAAQRIGLPSVWQAIQNALRPAAEAHQTAISHFYYPRYGFGQIPEALTAAFTQHNGRVLTNTIPLAIEPTRAGFTITVQEQLSGRTQQLQTRQLISTIPLNYLLHLLPHTTHHKALIKANQLHYRGLICLFLAFNKPQISGDSWTYFPDASFTCGRTHEPKNWSAALVPHDDVTSLAIEIFASPHEPIWHQPLETLTRHITAEFAQLGWFDTADVLHSWAVHLPQAYPVYHVGYEIALTYTKQYLQQWPQLHLLGRTGSFRYLNSDGVIEQVFEFLETLTHQLAFPQPEAVQALTAPHGRWV